MNVKTIGMAALIINSFSSGIFRIWRLSDVIFDRASRAFQEKGQNVHIHVPRLPESLVTPSAMLGEISWKRQGPPPLPEALLMRSLLSEGCSFSCPWGCLTIPRYCGAAVSISASCGGGGSPVFVIVYVTGSPGWGPEPGCLQFVGYTGSVNIGLSLRSAGCCRRSFVMHCALRADAAEAAG